MGIAIRQSGLIEMILIHGTHNGEITWLIPLQADHDRSYIYLSENEVVAGFYTINCVERTYYWFPYGFTRENIPYYDELYPNALKMACEGKTGFIYSVNTLQENLVPFKNIPGAWLSIVPLEVSSKKEVKDLFSWFVDSEKDGRLFIRRFEHQSMQTLEWYDNKILEYINEKMMIETPDCSYASFIQQKFPQIWQRYEDQQTHH
jgi:hypothetical protein